MIGFQITRLSSPYPAKFLPTVLEACRAAQVDLIVFPIGSLLGPFRFDYQLNALCSYFQPSNLDVLISLSATLKNFVADDVFLEFLDRLAGVPLISIAVPVQGVPSILSDNHKGAIKAVDHLIEKHGCRRLAFISGPRNNPDSQQRFEAFRQSLIGHGLPVDESLVYEGLFNRESGIEAMVCLLDERQAEFDALVFANDEMALGAQEELHRRGIAVGEQLAILGFDDIPEVALASPSLTTVRQPFAVQAQKAVEMALDQMAGRSVETEVWVPTEFVPRTSCGCLPAFLQGPGALGLKNSVPLSSGQLSLEPVGESDSGFLLSEVDGQADLNMLVQRLQSAVEGTQDAEGFLGLVYQIATRRNQTLTALEAWERIIRAVTRTFVQIYGSSPLLEQLRTQVKVLIPEARNILLARERLRLFDESARFQQLIEQLLVAEDRNALNEILHRSLPNLHVSNFFLILHPPVEYEDESHFLEVQPDRQLVFGLLQGRLMTANNPMPLVGNELLPRRLLGEPQLPFLVSMVLYHRTTMLGYVCLEPGEYSLNFYENLIFELGSSFKRILLVEQQQVTQDQLRQTLVELQKSNDRLSELSVSDELTGLYNRRGFLSRAEESLVLARRMKKESLLIFADLDGLKKINDTWGHAAGDQAIFAAAEVLKATFRQADVVGRLGGDEFVALTFDSPAQTSGIIRERLNQKVDQMNVALDQPWKLSMSVGIRPVNHDEAKNLHELLTEVDGLLYLQKLEKKKQHLSRED